MINNLNQIKSLLKFDSKDYFYHLQVLKRKKEHPELGSNSYVVKTYYIKSIEHLEKLFPEIQSICDFHNARAYINLNRRSFERLAYQSLKKITDCILNKDFKSVRKAYESVCGRFSNESGESKRWIIDFDTKLTPENIAGISMILHGNIDPIGEKVIDVIETKNGFHFITKPFNVTQFIKFYPDIEIHKNI
jgi:hypothetical protein